MKCQPFAALPILLALSACTGGSSLSSALPQDAPAALPLVAARALPQAAAAAEPAGSLSEVRSNAAVIAGSAAPAGANDLLYVANTGNNSITVYWHAASGNAAPLYVIGGPRTQINSPGQLAEDAQGNLYVANGRSNAFGTDPAILVFAHGAHGNVAPIRRLAGPLTGLAHVEAMTVDKGTGKIFVFDTELTNGGYFTSSLLRFAPNATGNSAPFARSALTLFDPIQIASDSTGNAIIEAHIPLSPNGVGYGVGALAKQFATNAALNYVSNTTWFSTGGVADDPTTKTYLVTTPAGIYRFAEGTNGSGPGGPGGQTFNPAPVSVITSDRCGSQLAVAPGLNPFTYVTHGTQSGCAADAVYVYTNNATGNAAPLRVLTGSATQMHQPYGITEGF